MVGNTLEGNIPPVAAEVRSVRIQRAVLAVVRNNNKNQLPDTSRLISVAFLFCIVPLLYKSVMEDNSATREARGNGNAAVQLQKTTLTRFRYRVPRSVTFTTFELLLSYTRDDLFLVTMDGESGKSG